MANPYKVFVRSISTDGTSLFLEVEVFDGLHTFPTIHPSFAVGTTAAEIRTYLQTIVDSQPILEPEFHSLIGTFISGQ